MKKHDKHEWIIQRYNMLHSNKLPIMDSSESENCDD